MADGDGSSSEPGDKYGEIESEIEEKSVEIPINSTGERVFKCCANKKFPNLVCINCYSVFHPSCSKKLSSKIKFIDNYRVICCEEDFGNDMINENQKLKIEVMYLKKLLGEVEEKNGILKENNKLLSQRLEYVQQKTLSTSIKNQNMQSEKSRNPIDINVKESNRSEVLTLSNLTSTQKPPSYAHRVASRNAKNTQVCGLNQVEPVNVNKSTDSTVEIDEQSSNKQTNVDDGIERNQSNTSTELKQDDGFQTVTRKINKKNISGNKRFLGKGEYDGEFFGYKSKAWLYIYRVQPQATESIISKYIREKLQLNNEAESGEVMVKELPSYNPSKKCFQVSAPLNKKDNLYEESFWPNGVGFRRFDFRRYNDYSKSDKHEDFQRT